MFAKQRLPMMEGWVPRLPPGRAGVQIVLLLMWFAFLVLSLTGVFDADSHSLGGAVTVLVREEMPVVRTGNNGTVTFFATSYKRV